ncbi:hypothetical protein BH18ACI5_BH18ACI5_10970 [soil metagenome]
MTPTPIVRTALALVLVTPLVPLVGTAQGTIATDRIFEAIGVKEGATVCEIGAGDGELSLAAAKSRRLERPGFHQRARRRPGQDAGCQDGGKRVVTDNSRCR